jgi:hypothetical protein
MDVLVDRIVAAVCVAGEVHHLACGREISPCIDWFGLSLAKMMEPASSERRNSTAAAISSGFLHCRLNVPTQPASLLPPILIFTMHASTQDKTAFACV